MKNEKNLEKVSGLLLGVVLIILSIPGFASGGVTLKIIFLLVGVIGVYQCLKPYIKDDNEEEK